MSGFTQVKMSAFNFRKEDIIDPKDIKNALYMTKIQFIAKPPRMTGFGGLGRSSEINFLIRFFD
jgi:hypothetical protein